MEERSASPKSPVGENKPKNRVPVMTFAGLHGLPHGITTRHGGVSPAPWDTLNLGLSTGDNEANVRTNRSRIAATFGVGPHRLMLGRLVHGNEVTVLSRGGRHRRAAEAGDEFPVFRSDAVVSDVPGTFVLLTFADCVPLVFWDPVRGVIGAAHAGWRGTSMGIGPEVIRAMHREWGTDPCDMVVGIGPSIGPCCYTVGAEVPEQFRRNGLEPSMVGTDAGARLDLWTTTERQLRSCGVLGDSIENMRLCTRCHRATFFSHRGEAGRTGRFGLCVGLPDA